MINKDLQAKIIFGNNLKKAISSHGSTQMFLADKMGVDLKTISNWCNGRSSPSKADKIQIENILKINIDTLIPIETNIEIEEPAKTPHKEYAEILLQILARIGSIENKIDRQEENNKIFLQIPPKVEAIETKIGEIHAKITSGNDQLKDLTKDIGIHSKEAMDTMLKMYGQRRPDAPPYRSSKKK